MKKFVENKKLKFGDGNVSVQSMTDLPVCDVENTCLQIRRLVSAGCDIVRIAVPNAKSAECFRKVRDTFSNLPLVADIHFDYRLAIAAMEAGADKIRINPGNIAKRQLDQVIACAKANDVIVRLGVNGGSVNRETLALCQGDKCEALYRSLKEYVNYFEDKNFNKLVLSVKSSDVRETVALNQKIATLNYPVHLGVTEAGPVQQGTIKNAIGIGALLLQGIGDTIRVSLTGDPVAEVEAGKQILRALGLRKGVSFVSCPQCGRCSVNLQQVAGEIFNYVKDVDKNLKIAVMGCEVNGPGECSDADLGIAGANGKFVFFRYGKKYKTVDADVAVEEFKREIDLLVKCL